MSDSCEPSKKRSIKESGNALPFYDINSEHDRILIVGKKKFYVKSEELASKSEYFRILFQSNFKEKEQKTIKLEEITAKNFEQFLIVLERPEDFKAIKCKLLDLIETHAYFNVTEPLNIIFKDANNCSRIDKRKLLESGKTFSIPLITTAVENWFIYRFVYTTNIVKYQQLQLSVEFDMKRLENMLLNFFTRNYMGLMEVMGSIHNDNSEIGKTVYEKVKKRAFDAFSEKDFEKGLYAFTSGMNESQFDCIKDEMESLILATLPKYTEHELIHGFNCDLRHRHLQKLTKLKAFVTDHFIKTFPTSHFQGDILHSVKENGLNDVLEFTIDHLISEFRNTKAWTTIYYANLFNLDRLQVFLKNYARDNSDNLSEDVKRQIEQGSDSQDYKDEQDYQYYD